MQTVFLDAVLFLGIKQMQMSKFNTLLLQRLANFMSSVDKLIVSYESLQGRLLKKEKSISRYNGITNSY